MKNIDTYLSRRSFIGGISFLALFGALVGCSTNSDYQTPDKPDDSFAEKPKSDASTNAEVSSQSEDDFVTVQTFAFDTIVTLSVYGSQDILNQAVQECNRYEELLSRTIEGSDIWRINTAGGKPVQVSDETADLLKKSLTFCEASGGIFDITIGSVSSLWDFTDGIKPADDAIKRALEHVNYRNLQLDGTTVQLNDPEAQLDLGGIAKGWIADQLADFFKQNGIQSGLINLGGNVLAIGEKPGGEPWRIAIQDPNSPHGEHVAALEVRDSSVVTSGLYERHFVLDGVDYHHILDPETGYPAQTDLLSDTIVSKHSIDGDGLSTTLFIEGSQAGLSRIEAIPNTEAILIDSSNNISLSSGMSNYRYVLFNE